MNENKKELSAKPNKTSWWEIFGKIFIWIVVGAIISGLLFIILATIWWPLTESAWQKNPILPLLLIVSWFFASFVGNLWVSGLYSLFFSKKYFNMNKSIWVLLLTNWLLFVFLLFIYITFNWDTDKLFLILGFHIIIATFLSSQQLENMRNPNYSAASLIWNTLSLAIIMLIYWIVWKFAAVWWRSQNQIYLLLLVPPVLSFGVMPLGLGIRDMIYYKFFEIWNDPFYAESKWELNQKELDYLDKEEKINEIDEDINVDIN